MYFIKNWKILLIGTLGLILGILGNMYANHLSEKRIIEALTAQLEALKNKRLTSDEQNRLIELQAKLHILQNK